MVTRNEGLDYSTGQGYSLLDAKAARDARDGYSVVSGLEVTTDGTNLTLDVSAGSATVGQTSGSVDTVSLASAGTVTLDAADSTDPRKDTVYIDTSGTLVAETGVPEPADPSGNTRFNTYQPEPPTPSTEGTILAEVWISAGASSIASADIRDRRVPSEWVGDTVTAKTVDAVSVQNDTGNSALHSRFDGLVVPVANGLGMVDAIDPATTTTPIQDAIDLVAAASNYGGKVYVPADTIDVGTLTPKSDVLVEGYGSRPSILRWPAGTVAVDITGSPKNFGFKNIHFSRQGTNETATPMIREVENGSQSRQFSLINCHFRDFHGSIIETGGGASPYEWQFSRNFATNFDAGDVDAAIYLGSTTGSVRHMLFGDWLMAPVDTQSASDTTLFKAQTDSHFPMFEYLNIGGTTGQIWSGGTGYIGGFNYEPVGQNTTPSHLIFVNGTKPFYCLGPTVTSPGNGADRDANFVYGLGSSSGKKFLMPMDGASSFTSFSNQVEITGTPSEASFYLGASSEITNTVGSATGLVRSLATAGTGNG